MALQKLINQVQNCTLCYGYLPRKPRPILNLGKNTRIYKDFPEEELDMTKEKETPLYEKLDNMANDIGKFAFGSGVIIFLALSAYMVIKIIFVGKLNEAKVYDLL